MHYLWTNDNGIADDENYPRSKPEFKKKKYLKLDMITIKVDCSGRC